MTDADRLLLVDDLVRDEGLRLKVYPDAKGIPTIGVGRNLRDVGISVAEAQFLLGNDIADVFADLDRYLPWWRGLDSVRQRALANMAFNLGLRPETNGKLLTFTETLALIRDGEYARAADHMLTLPWAQQVGPRAVRLAKMMREGAPPAI